MFRINFHKCFFGSSLCYQLSKYATNALGLTLSGLDCFDKICHPPEEFCSTFAENCMQCSLICNETAPDYQADLCVKECLNYNTLQLEPLKHDIHAIQMQQHVILILLILLLILCCVRYLWKCLLWIKHKRYVPQLVKKLRSRKSELTTMQNGKDLGGTTIQNMCAIQNEVERTPSQIFSVTAAEGSVMTMTTPISSRYPAENTTPTTEYTYDNQALAVTPVSEKPTSSGVI
uniref:Protein grindelwald n=1 Tax=Glossina brevipalpis TaxID=37001 RepID=A0A1A9W0L6_9MUSC